MQPQRQLVPTEEPKTEGETPAGSSKSGLLIAALFMGLLVILMAANMKC